MQDRLPRHRRALMALGALVVGLALPLLVAATTVSASAAAADVATQLHDGPSPAHDRLAPMVAAPALRASPAPTPATLPVIVLAALLLAALAGSTGGTRRPLAWTLVRPDRVIAARGGSLSTAWRAPPTVR